MNRLKWACAPTMIAALLFAGCGGDETKKDTAVPSKSGSPDPVKNKNLNVDASKDAPKADPGKGDDKKDEPKAGGDAKKEEPKAGGDDKKDEPKAGGDAKKDEPKAEPDLKAPNVDKPETKKKDSL